MFNWCDNFKHLQLHRIPFLTTDVLALVIPHMRNLESLGVYQCPLIHIGKGKELLEIIRTDRPLGKVNKIHLDFYPNFHQGPIPDGCNPNFTGSYGVSSLIFLVSAIWSRFSHSLSK